MESKTILGIDNSSNHHILPGEKLKEITVIIQTNKDQVVYCHI